jgi:cytochrome c oxidase cbb3-type subunit 4
MGEMDFIRGAILIALIVGFVGVWVWAWSKKRKPEFDRAARMPLEEDAPNEPVERRPGVEEE